MTQPQGLAGTTAMDSTYEQFHNYPFEIDPIFKQGVESIVPPSNEGNVSPEENEILVAKAKIFYFARMTGQPVTWEGHLEYEARREPTKPDDSSDELIQVKEEEQLSFQALAELISTGELGNIPYNRVIPNVISDEKPSESHAPLRKKPWES